MESDTEHVIVDKTLSAEFLSAQSIPHSQVEDDSEQDPSFCHFQESIVEINNNGVVDQRGDVVNYDGETARMTMEQTEPDTEVFHQDTFEIANTSQHKSNDIVKSSEESKNVDISAVESQISSEVAETVTSTADDESSQPIGMEMKTNDVDTIAFHHETSIDTVETTSLVQLTDSHSAPQIQNVSIEDNNNGNGDPEVPCCRVCHGESEPNRELFYPCKCDGSIKYIHQDCLMLWLKHSKQFDPANGSGSSEPPRCELCGEPFRFKQIYKEGAALHLSILDLVFELLPRIFGVIKTLINKTILVILWICVLPLFCAGWMRVVWNHLCYGINVESWLAGSSLLSEVTMDTLTLPHSLEAVLKSFGVSTPYEALETLSQSWISGLSHFCTVIVISFLLFEVANFLYKEFKSLEKKHVLRLLERDIEKAIIATKSLESMNEVIVTGLHILLDKCLYAEVAFRSPESATPKLDREIEMMIKREYEKEEERREIFYMAREDIQVVHHQWLQQRKHLLDSQAARYQQPIPMQPANATVAAAAPLLQIQVQLPQQHKLYLDRATGNITGELDFASVIRLDMEYVKRLGNFIEQVSVQSALPLLSALQTYKGQVQELLKQHLETSTFSGLPTVNGGPIINHVVDQLPPGVLPAAVQSYTKILFLMSPEFKKLSNSYLTFRKDVETALERFLEELDRNNAAMKSHSQEQSRETDQTLAQDGEGDHINSHLSDEERLMAMLRAHMGITENETIAHTESDIHDETENQEERGDGEMKSSEDVSHVDVEDNLPDSQEQKELDDLEAEREKSNSEGTVQVVDEEALDSDVISLMDNVTSAEEKEHVEIEECKDADENPTLHELHEENSVVEVRLNESLEITEPQQNNVMEVEIHNDAAEDTPQVNEELEHVQGAQEIVIDEQPIAAEPQLQQPMPEPVQAPLPPPVDNARDEDPAILIIEEPAEDGNNIDGNNNNNPNQQNIVLKIGYRPWFLLLCYVTVFTYVCLMLPANIGRVSVQQSPTLQIWMQSCQSLTREVLQEEGNAALLTKLLDIKEVEEGEFSADTGLVSSNGFQRKAPTTIARQSLSSTVVSNPTNGSDEMIASATSPGSTSTIHTAVDQILQERAAMADQLFVKIRTILEICIGYCVLFSSLVVAMFLYSLKFLTSYRFSWFSPNPHANQPQGLFMTIKATVVHSVWSVVNVVHTIMKFSLMSFLYLFFMPCLMTLIMLKTLRPCFQDLFGTISGTDSSAGVTATVDALVDDLNRGENAVFFKFPAFLASLDFTQASTILFAVVLYLISVMVMLHSLYVTAELRKLLKMPYLAAFLPRDMLWDQPLLVAGNVLLDNINAPHHQGHHQGLINHWNWWQQRLQARSLLAVLRGFIVKSCLLLPGLLITIVIPMRLGHLVSGAFRSPMRFRLVLASLNQAKGTSESTTSTSSRWDSQLPMEMLMSHVLIPLFLERIRYSATVQTILRYSVHYLAKTFGILDIVIWEGLQQQPNIPVVPQVQAPADEVGQARAEGDVALENVAIETVDSQQTTSFFATYFPRDIRFSMMIFALTFEFAILSSWCIHIPLYLGRFMMDSMSMSSVDIVNYPIGLLIAYCVGYTAHYFLHDVVTNVFHNLQQDRQGNNIVGEPNQLWIFMKIVWKWMVLILELIIAGACWLVIPPFLIGYCVEYITVFPFRVGLHATPIFPFLQAWALGLVLLKVFCRCVLTGVFGEIDLRNHMEMTIIRGFAHFDFLHFMKHVFAPVTIPLLDMVCFPFFISRFAGAFTDNYVIRTALVRFSLHGWITLRLLYSGLKSLVKRIISLHNEIRDTRYLVGTELTNRS